MVCVLQLFHLGLNKHNYNKYHGHGARIVSLTRVHIYMLGWV